MMGNAQSLSSWIHALVLSQRLNAESEQLKPCAMQPEQLATHLPAVHGSVKTAVSLLPGSRSSPNLVQSGYQSGSRTISTVEAEAHSHRAGMSARQG